MKNKFSISPALLNEFKLQNLHLKELVYHKNFYPFPLNLLFMFPDIKWKVERCIKQTLFYFTKRQKLDKNKLNILIYIAGGIGDVILTRNFINTLRNTLPQAHITISYRSKEVIDLIYKEQKSSEEYNLVNDFVYDKHYDAGCYIKDYDLFFKGLHFFAYDYINYKTISEKAPSFLPIIKKGEDLQKYLKTYIQSCPYLDGIINRQAVNLGLNRRTISLFLAGFENIEENDIPYYLNPDKQKQILEKFNLSGKKYITIHDGIDNNLRNTFYSVRRWPQPLWENFIKIFKQKYPDISIVQLGAKNSKTFKNIDISLINKTKLEDLPHILDKSIIHVDTESGLCHMAKLVNTKSLVLFGATNKDYLSYPQNINIKANNCENCMWITNNWTKQCPLNLKKYCMETISPEEVFSETEKYINTKYEQ